MSKNTNFQKALFLCMALSLALASCNLPSQQAQTDPTQPVVIMLTPTRLADTPTVEPATDTPAPAETPTAEPPTPTVEQAVIFKASGGGLNVRRGPGTAYNVVCALPDGLSAKALGRTQDGTWLLVALDGQDCNGWVYMKTNYSTVEGNIENLVVENPDPPVPAFIRNCTYHPMQVSPGDFVLKPQTESLDNKKQVNPGKYSVVDTTNMDTPGKVILTLSLSEGDTVDITKDYLGNVYACP